MSIYRLNTSFKPNLKQYGEVKKIPTFMLSIPLDMIIPFTFGLITLGSHKLFGKNIRINIHNEDLK